MRIVDGDYPSITGVRLVTETEEADPNDSTVIIGIEDITVSFEVSSNGRGGWTAVDEDDVDYVPADSGAGTPGMTTLSLKDGDGEYYRAVVTYNADTGEDAATERVYSDPIQVANVRNADATTPLAPITIAGSLNPGGTLSVNVNATVTVQWQIQESVTVSGSAVTDWVNIPGATGDLRLTQAHAGENIRAVVSYQSRDPDNPGVTAVVATPSQAIGGTASDVAPNKVRDYEIEDSVDGTGHGRFNTENISAASGGRAGHNATIEHTVPLASLFQDPDTSSFLLNFEAGDLERTDRAADGSTSNTDLVAISAATQTGATATGGITYVYEQSTANGGGVLVFEAKSGKLTYLSDAYRTHDGDNTDGAGNVLKLSVTANDPGAPSPRSDAAVVSLRINVAPTDITFDDDGDSGTTMPTFAYSDASYYDGKVERDLPQITIAERKVHTGDEVLATLDVQDENWSGTTGIPGHKFGTHEITVTGDDRFVITKSGGADARRDSDSDGSTWELRVVKGATFDYETDDADGNPDNGVQILLTFVATDGGGLSTPTPHSPGSIYSLPSSWLHYPIQLVVTITDNPIDNPPRPGPKETPGLKDNNENNDMDDTTDDDTDSETDGGDPTPPPPGMSLGGIIEDFIDNMDGYDQDLLEDFLLTIDDGLDIA